MSNTSPRYTVISDFSAGISRKHLYNTPRNSVYDMVNLQPSSTHNLSKVKGSKIIAKYADNFVFTKFFKHDEGGTVGILIDENKKGVVTRIYPDDSVEHKSIDLSNNKYIDDLNNIKIRRVDNKIYIVNTKKEIGFVKNDVNYLANVVYVRLLVEPTQALLLDINGVQGDFYRERTYSTAKGYGFIYSTSLKRGSPRTIEEAFSNITNQLRSQGVVVSRPFPDTLRLEVISEVIDITVSGEESSGVAVITPYNTKPQHLFTGGIQIGYKTKVRYPGTRNEEELQVPNIYTPLGWRTTQDFDEPKGFDTSTMPHILVEGKESYEVQEVEWDDSEAYNPFEFEQLEGVKIQDIALYQNRLVMLSSDRALFSSPNRFTNFFRYHTAITGLPDGFVHVIGRSDSNSPAETMLAHSGMLLIYTPSEIISLKIDYNQDNTPLVVDSVSSTIDTLTNVDPKQYFGSTLTIGSTGRTARVYYHEHQESMISSDTIDTPILNIVPDDGYDLLEVSTELYTMFVANKGGNEFKCYARIQKSVKNVKYAWYRRVISPSNAVLENMFYNNGLLTILKVGNSTQIVKYDQSIQKREGNLLDQLETLTTSVELVSENVYSIVFDGVIGNIDNLVVHVDGVEYEPFTAIYGIMFVKELETTPIIDYIRVGLNLTSIIL